MSWRWGRQLTMTDAQIRPTNLVSQSSAPRLRTLRTGADHPRDTPGYVVIELVKGELFTPEHVEHSGFYLCAENTQLKAPADAPNTSLLLCPLPANLQDDLSSIEHIEPPKLHRQQQLVSPSASPSTPPAPSTEPPSVVSVKQNGIASTTCDAPTLREIGTSEVSGELLLTRWCA